MSNFTYFIVTEDFDWSMSDSMEETIKNTLVGREKVKVRLYAFPKALCSDVGPGSGTRPTFKWTEEAMSLSRETRQQIQDGFLIHGTVRVIGRRQKNFEMVATF